MAVRIRLTRVGAHKQPSYRVVVADGRSARDGRSLETLGHYNPRSEPTEVKIDAEKATAWMAKGAQPSDTVARLSALVAEKGINLFGVIDHSGEAHAHGLELRDTRS